MEKKVIADEIKHLIEVITEQNDTIKKHTSYIPQIELDITMGNIRNLYERYNELQKLNSLDAPVSKYVEEKKAFEVAKTVVHEISTEKEVPQVVAEIVEVREIPVVAEETVSSTLFAGTPPVVEEKKEEPVVAEKISKHVSEVNENKEVLEASEKKTKAHKKASADLFSTAATTLADKFKDETKSINEKFSNSEKKEKSLADKMQEKPIKDLKAAIGINDKFKFINELFDGNLQAYNDCVAKLNAFASFEEAGNFLDGLRVENNWANDNESLATLSDMVIRRYL